MALINVRQFVMQQHSAFEAGQLFNIQQSPLLLPGLWFGPEISSANGKSARENGKLQTTSLLAATI